ncbi:uncharacterized protein LOC106072152 isoform X2 [Biomphalaria glabrata]|uniref:Uncharacterized protein LOC106072152 isoform X2 n=1 Tax=Biomphalaria glabrata TaxID=6526 RepID=A0A9W3ARD1_BIOGL|nr:uncharacterized protein LOC106072152 isoform X2 [Biomphalaria glabrata]
MTQKSFSVTQINEQDNASGQGSNGDASSGSSLSNSATTLSYQDNQPTAIKSETETRSRRKKKLLPLFNCCGLGRNRESDNRTNEKKVRRRKSRSLCCHFCCRKKSRDIVNDADVVNDRTSFPILTPINPVNGNDVIIVQEVPVSHEAVQPSPSVQSTDYSKPERTGRRKKSKSSGCCNCHRKKHKDQFYGHNDKRRKSSTHSRQETLVPGVEIVQPQPPGIPQAFLRIDHEPGKVNVQPGTCCSCWKRNFKGKNETGYCQTPSSLSSLYYSSSYGS